MAKVVIGNAIQSDALYLQAVDNRCFYKPYTLEEWREFASEQRCMITTARFLGSVVGFSIIKPVKNSKDISIERLAVSPHSQGYGIGTKLLNHIFEFAKKSGFKKIFCVVPEQMCAPHAEQNAAMWFVRREFEIVRVDRDEVSENGINWDNFILEANLT